MEEDLENAQLQENYYQLLNISKTATIEEINTAYRRFSLMFHPDKHSTDPGRQKSAEQIFSKIKEAYEVLSDPQKRVIYDTLGKKGLEVQGWQVVFRTRTPKEIREEFERLKQEKQERRLHQSANPRGTISLSINATDLFTKYYDEYEILEERQLPNIEVSSMAIQQSIDIPVSLKDTTTLTGNITTQNGIGAGSLSISNRHLNSDKGWTECDMGIGNGPVVGFKMFRNLSRLMFLNCGTSMHFTARGIAPSFVSTMAMQFNAQSVGYLTYKAGGSGGSSMTTMYVRDSKSFHTNTSVQISNPHAFISISVMYKLPEYDMKLRWALKLGTVGAVAEYGAERKVSPNSSVSASVSVGVPSGVMLKLKWTCSAQTIVLPIHLCEEVMPSPIFYASIVPIITWLAINKFVIDPIAKEKAQRERQKTMEANFERLLEMQRQARATVDLMKESYYRIRSEEEKRNGLLILKALYGKLPEGVQSHDLSAAATGDTSTADADILLSEIIDVTIQLQCLVKNSKLELVEDSKVDLPGFYDPSIGEDKHLTVQYSFRKNLYCHTFSDNKAVILPRNSHMVKKRS